MNIEIANRLVQYRKMRGMSQEELASELGLSRQAVSKWERAEASPDTDNLISLARLYGVSLDTLLLADEPPAASNSVLNEPASTPSTSVFDETPPAAPNFTEGYTPPDEDIDDLPHYSYGDSREQRELSPGAKMVIKIGMLAVFIVLFLVYGVLSWIFPGLHGAYPLICTAIYLVWGFIFGTWHPSWLIYLSIPIFYTMF